MYMKKPKDPDGTGMEKLVVLIPQALKAEMRGIRASSGVSIAQQVRLSLLLWCRAVAKNPHGALGLLGNETARGYKLGQWGPGNAPQSAQDGPGDPIAELEALWANDPEPDIHSEPSKWASWSRRQGDATVRALARGKLPTRHKLD
jgi:hypothetical protein